MSYGNALIIYRNHADRAVLTVPATTTVIGQVDALKTRQAGEYAEFDGELGAMPQVEIQFPAACRPTFWGLFGLNLARVGPAELSDPPQVQLHRWNPAADDWTEEPIQLPRDNGSCGHLGQLMWLIPASGSHADRWRLTLHWTTQISQGRPQNRRIGRLWAARPTQDIVTLEHGVDINWSRYPVDLGDHGLVADGSGTASAGPIVRGYRFTASAVPDLPMWGFTDGASEVGQVASIDNLQYTIGTTGEVIILPRTSHPLWIHRLGVRGWLPRGIGWQSSGAGLHTLTGEIQEYGGGPRIPAPESDGNGGIGIGSEALLHAGEKNTGKAAAKAR